MPRTELSEKERERRVQVILDATKNVFLKKGYFKTTMLDIAEESGLSRRTIYLYFSNKDDLTYEIIVNAFTHLRDLILDVSKSDKSGYERLLDIKGVYIGYYNNQFANVVFTMYFDFKLNTQIIEDRQIKECFNLISEIVDIIESCVIIGINDGSIRDNIADTRKISIAAINIIHATIQKLAVRAEIIEAVTSYSSKELIDEMFDIFFQSIKS